MNTTYATISDLKREITNLGPNVLFRGHSSAEYQIRPSIGRIDAPKETIQKIESTIFKRFKLQSHQYFHSIAKSDLDWLILARHYGLNTRLLDWTRNFYVALYFALQNRSPNCFEPFSIIAYKSPEFCSYFDLSEINPFDIDKTIFFEPPLLDARIQNQHSILLIHPSPKDSDTSDNIYQFALLPHESHLEIIKSELIQAGITHSTIYPGPEGIAKHLNENPHEMDVNLDIRKDMKGWKPVSRWMIGKTQNELIRMLREECSFLAALEVLIEDPNNLIGIPVEINGKPIGNFFSYSPKSEVITISDSDFNLMRFEKCDKRIAEMKLNKKHAHSIFPQEGFTFIRPIKKRDKPTISVLGNSAQNAAT